MVHGLLGYDLDKTLTQADKDAGFTSIEEVDASAARGWAVENVEATREAHKSFWKSI